MINPDDITTVIVAAGSAATTLTLILQKIYAVFKAERVGIVTNDAQATIVDTLNEQLKMFAEHNAELQSKVETLQNTNTKLTFETAELKHTVKMLTSENKELQTRIQLLEAAIDNLTGALNRSGIIARSIDKE